MIPYQASLSVCLGGDKVMYEMKVCSTGAETGDTAKAFFTVLYGAVHYLIQRPVVLKQPCFVPFRDWEPTRLTHRVYVCRNTVYKLYGTKFDVHPARSIEAHKHFPKDNLQELTFRKLTDRVGFLQYKYISGASNPLHLHQFATIMQLLNNLHVKDVVHGDMRKENLLFGDTVEQAWIVDFDHSASENSLYPAGYNSTLPGRHKDACPAMPMKKSHDRYSLAFIISDTFPNNVVARQTSEHLTQCTALLTIANNLLANNW